MLRGHSKQSKKKLNQVQKKITQPRNVWFKIYEAIIAIAWLAVL